MHKNLSNSNARRVRSAFTLVEILVVVTIIGILVGMITAGVLPLLKRARGIAVTVELKQMESAIEQFKNNYGFYPPSFEAGMTSRTPSISVGVADFDGLLPYLNKLAPNHAELGDSGVAGSDHATINVGGNKTHLEHWWDETGAFLDQESALVFWLTGVCKNKQYPITGGTTAGATGVLGTPPIAAHGYSSDGIERDVFFAFKGSNIMGDDANEVVRDASLAPIPAKNAGLILEYRHVGGSEGSTVTSPDGTTGVTDYRFKYRDAITYDIGGGNLAYYDGTNDGLPPGTPPAAPANYAFANPNSFQLLSFGLDGLPGVPGNIHAIKTGTQTISMVDFFGSWGTDNIVNFGEAGVLQAYAIEKE